MGTDARLDRLVGRLVDEPIDAASLALFRVLFGLVMAASMARFIALGWVEEFYVRPTFHFTWAPFPWVQPLPAPLMHLLFVALVVFAIGIAVGYHYRASTALFFAGFTYVELIDKTTYLNHYYLVTLLTGLLLIVPAHRVWSIDAVRRPTGRSTVPAWTVNALRFQVAIVYVFAGLAKINTDWLLEAQPLRIWLAARSDVPVIGAFLGEPWVPYAFSWMGAAYDLGIVFLLLWRRTRLVAYVLVIAFHVMTALLFPIGMFPWIMIVATLIFLPVRRRHLSTVTPRRPRLLVPALAIYALIQVVVPLRAYWPGTDPEWTGRGFNYAWRVMIAEKAGVTEFIVFQPSTARQWRVQPREYVSERQEKMMAQDPFMIRALARHIADDFRARGIGDVEVHAESFATLNDRPAQRLIDPRLDLAAQPSQSWILSRQFVNLSIRQSVNSIVQPVAEP